MTSKMDLWNSFIVKLVTMKVNSLHTCIFNLLSFSPCDRSDLLCALEKIFLRKPNKYDSWTFSPSASCYRQFLCLFCIKIKFLLILKASCNSFLFSFHPTSLLHLTYSLNIFFFNCFFYTLHLFSFSWLKKLPSLS